jgi:hypothetical protein
MWFVVCLWYVLMSFDVKIDKINHGGTETQRRSQKSDFRFEISEERGLISWGRERRGRGSGKERGRTSWGEEVRSGRSGGQEKNRR